MCGIVGYVGPREATPILVDGLKRLEYRGYDSAGIAVLGDDGFVRVTRSEGKLGNLTARIEGEPLAGRTGIGHTRWATHGRPSEENAHPHRDASGRVVVIHNGIIENFLPLKKTLLARGVPFTSETDSEVIAQAIGAERSDSPGTPFGEVVRSVLSRMTGMYAVVVLSADEPHVLYVAKNGPPIVLGLGEGENLVASDATALLPHTRDLVFLEDGDFVRLTATTVEVTGLDGVPRSRPARRVPWDAVAAEKGGYPHFMAKEIAEQPTVVVETVGHKLSLETGRFSEDAMGVSPKLLAGVDRIVIVACGTSWHAGLVGKFLLEEVARVPVEVDYSSEFRYRRSLVGPRTLVVGISQSGETADTVAALTDAKRSGAPTVGVVNVPGSAIARLVDGVLATHAGPEIGVASTKAFTTQLVALALLAFYAREARGLGSLEPGDPFLDGLAHLPVALQADPRPRTDDREALPLPRPRARRPLPRPRGALPGGPRGGAQAEGDLLHPRRGVPGGGDEARPDRAHRRGAPRRRPRPEGRPLRQGRLEPQGSEGAGGAAHRSRLARRRGRLDVRRRDPRGPARPPGAPARRVGRPAPAPGVPRRAAAGLRRRPAEEPRQVGHR